MADESQNSGPPVHGGPSKTTIKGGLKAEVPGIGAAEFEVSREYTGDSPLNRSFASMIMEFFGGQPPKLSDPRNADFFKSLQERARIFVPPNLAEYKVDNSWAQIEVQPSVTAVVSGKGGVGKSTISLALTEAFSSEENVLLLDFDLHNRGLTSKYRGLKPEMSNVLGELQRFRQLIVHSKDLIRDGSNLSLSSIKPDVFHKLRHEYCYPQQDKLSPLTLNQLYMAKVVKEFKPTEGQRPRNCYFLPSRLPGVNFLGSAESRLDAAEIALFLMFLGHRARQSPAAITRIVVDCHGAHDMFMVGAILAADQVVIVTKAEESAFEGTIELVRFAQSAVAENNVIPRVQTLIFNELRQEDQDLAQLLYELYYVDNKASEFKDVLKIPGTEAIRNELKYYDRPSLLTNSDISSAIIPLRKIGVDNRRL